MTEPENFEDDLFADLYDDNDASRNGPGPAKPVPAATVPPVNTVDDTAQNDHNEHDAHMKQDDEGEAEDNEVDFNLGADYNTVTSVHPANEEDADSNGGYGSHKAASKEEGKMFIGGLNWETTDESLKEYFAQFGEVVECTVMRDSATGRSRGFGFLTFKDAKTVNIVMVKEHFLDGKIIDPKRAIPRDEQEKTSKIFVGGVSQDTTDQEFRDYFAQFGRVVDATLMMDKDTGRPRGFGFVTFESEAGVDACINVPLEIHGKPIEVKKAQPRGNLREEEEAAKKNKFNRQDQNQSGMNQGGSNNGMTPQAMAQYFQRMQQYFAMMQQQMAMRGGMQMNPAMWQNMMQMQQMQQMMGRGGGQGGPGMMGGNMNPQMMQQMQQMQQQMMQQQQLGQGQGNEQGFDGGNNNYNQFQQGGGRRGGRGGGGQNSYEGMYDDPQPGGTGSYGSPDPQNAPPANAPTGPKNAGRPGANYRGGGRGGNRGFHPYAR